MKAAHVLVLALLAGLCGVLAFVTLRKDPQGESRPESMPSKSGTRLTSSSIGESRRWLEASRGNSRVAFRQWASGLNDEELHRHGLSFLSLLKASTAPEEWQDRRQMREILAALFMEWGKRDIDGVETSLKGADGLMADLALPTALAGFSESKPREALDRLREWETNEDSLMEEPASIIATFHLAKVNPQEAFERVKHGNGEMEGLGAALTDPGERAAVLKWLKIQMNPETREPEKPWANDGYYGRLQVELARGWSRHDLPAAWDYLSESDEYTVGDIITLPEWEFWENVGIGRPEAAMAFVLEHLAARRDEDEKYVNAVDAAFHGALQSAPDATLTRLIREKSKLGEDWVSYVPSESGAGSSDNESIDWPLDEASLLSLPVSVRNERILSRIHEFGLRPEEEDEIRERLKWRFEWIQD